ncbi:hypothetical protein QCA50_017737 [Cerrena zonata]|uniref:Uncharacterized protein n=1 Tax=Cerrena zonata TaxID=2478898 RepID=A0AAW0FJN6_9APHY
MEQEYLTREAAEKNRIAAEQQEEATVEHEYLQAEALARKDLPPVNEDVFAIDPSSPTKSLSSELIALQGLIYVEVASDSFELVTLFFTPALCHADVAISIVGVNIV